jgi:hypothetical protein
MWQNHLPTGCRRRPFRCPANSGIPGDPLHGSWGRAGCSTCWFPYWAALVHRGGVRTTKAQPRRDVIWVLVADEGDRGQPMHGLPVTPHPIHRQRLTVERLFGDVVLALDSLLLSRTSR